MAAFILRRMLQLVFVLWGGATLLFFLFYTLPNSPAQLIASSRGNRNPNPQVVKNLERKLGLDKSIPVQYVHYMDHLVHGDLGTSYATGASVVSIAKDDLPHSLRLAFWAILLEAWAGIAGGMLSARRRNSLGDYFTTIAAVLAGAVPVFVLGLLIQQVTGITAYQHSWPAWARFPVLGYGPDRWLFATFPLGHTWKYLFEPTIVLASVSTAIIARITRTSMLETMRQDHVRTARAKGLRERRVMRRHVLRNALVPVVTILGVDFGTLVGAAILTESVFGLHGLGSQIVNSAQIQDLPVVLGLTLIVTLIYGVASLAVDISYALLNPRVRLGSIAS